MNNFEKLVSVLIDKEMKISAAESCTGGLFAAGIVSVADASKVLDGSFVTYAESAKSCLVGVNPETIEKYTVVSCEVAHEMAAGAAAKMNCAAGVGITGVAGPSGGTEDCPVGTVCFGFYVNGKVITERRQFEAAGRNTVRTAAADYAAQRMTELICNS